MIIRRVILPTLALALAAGSILQAEEKKITRAELPSVVEKALVQQTNGATLRGLSKEVENGKTFYEAELTVNGHGRDVVFDESGQLVEVEEEMALESLPAAVRDGLRSAAGTGQIVKVESLTKLGKLVAYEAAVKTDGKRTEIKVAPDGKKLAKQ